MRLEIHFPRPPSLNHNHVNNSKGGRFKAERYTAWIKRAGLLLNPQIAGWETLRGPVKVAVSFNKRGDIDNYLKPCLDLLQRHAVFRDDKQVIALQAYHDPQCGDLMFVHVEAADDAQAIRAGQGRAA